MVVGFAIISIRGGEIQTARCSSRTFRAATTFRAVMEEIVQRQDERIRALEEDVAKLERLITN